MKKILLKGGNIIDVSSLSIYRGNILIDDGVISAISETSDFSNESCEIIDLNNRFICPGLIDSHIHIESSMISPAEFAKAAVIHGTSTVLADPHEITNIFGTSALDLFLEQSDILPINMYIGIPSCVPATRLETSGAEIGITQINKYLRLKNVYGLAEMMSYSDILNGTGDAREKVEAVFRSGLIVDGHCPGLRGKDLIGYMTNGHNDGIIRIMNDHETSDPKEAIEKLESGLFLALRYGSPSRDMEQILPELIRRRIPLDMCMLCSDDLSPDELLNSGHMDRIIRKASLIIAENSDNDLIKSTLIAIKMATKTPGQYLTPFIKKRKLNPTGELKKGYSADITVLKSLRNMDTEMVFHRGRIVVKNSVCVAALTAYDYSPYLNSLRVGIKIDPDTFKIISDTDSGYTEVNLIEIIPGTILTKLSRVRLDTLNHEIFPAPLDDIIKIAVFERHKSTGNYCCAFVRGLGIKRFAVASTIAHDSHNLIVAGVDGNDMAKCSNLLIQKGGGIAVYANHAFYHLPLQIAGLMSTETIQAVTASYREVKNAVKLTGSGVENLFMIMGFLALPVIPEARITDMGIIDVKRQKIIPLTA